MCESGEIGRRAGLRIQFPNRSGGSSPFSRTTLKKEWSVMSASNPITFIFKPSHEQFGIATITIPKEYVQALYLQASQCQQSELHTMGFSRGNTPLSYINENFQPHLIEHGKEFFFKYFVLRTLYTELFKQKILLAGDPFLQDISLSPDHGGIFTFSLTLTQPMALGGWKRIPFKAPKRKNYKDLDRQVEHFLRDEEIAMKNTKPGIINIGDWINFSLQLLDKHKKPIWDAKEYVWLKIGDEESDSPFQTLFLDKKVGTTFISDSICLQEYFSSRLDTHYLFAVTIIDHLPQSYFCIEHFKHHFRIKQPKEVHQKLIEIFSYRNDISQRRATVEESLRALLSKHSFTIQQHVLLRQQEAILKLIHSNPDYPVYKMQSDFREKIMLLAEKQVKENIFTHQFALHENIAVNNTDIKGYLNLNSRPRTSEFIYFEPPFTKHLGYEVPLSATLLSLCCLKEKTLNYAIHHLTKVKPA